MAFPSNPIYKLVNHPITGELINIRTAKDDFIPIAEDNTDYKKYLKWVSEGGVAEAAD
tara:strand:+ start:404 stop:577 length:174 start_codon:yes stop_codon:yes gene_type:complete